MEDASKDHQLRSGFGRYHRQMLCPQIGEAGQRRLADSAVTLIGCGALGTVIADSLVRAGVGRLRIVDRDFVELNNLQRQVLFDEGDVEAGVPKAVAAAEKLSRVNSTVQIEPIVADAHGGNILPWAQDAALIMDGTDNFETRFLINDVSVKLQIPWVYGACIATGGMMMPILPGQTACLRCVWSEPPPPGSSPTCDTAGILGTTVHFVATLQVNEALKILTGRLDDVTRHLVQIDAWRPAMEHFEIGAARTPDCPCCGQRRFEYLDRPAGDRQATLCGRNAVQIGGGDGAMADLSAVAARVAPVAKRPLLQSRYLLRFTVDHYAITLFRDGRAIIQGTQDITEARSAYARYIGS
jgi:adenylyltransferase/sulfurtransferase